MKFFENSVMDENLIARRRQRAKEQVSAYALLLPFIIVFVLFSLLPFVMGFVYLFMKYDPYNLSATQFYGLKNFDMLFNTEISMSKEFWESFAPVTVYALCTFPIGTIVAFVLAYFVNMCPPGYKFFRACIYLPSLISISIAGIVFCNIFGPSGSGLLNSWFGTDIDWLGGKPFQDDFLRWVIILIVCVWLGTGGNFVIYAGVLKDIPKSLYEACEMDGGGRWRKILHVTLPGMKSTLSLTMFGVVIGMLSLYGQPYVLNTIENEHILVGPMMWIQKYLTAGLEYASLTGYICAAAFVLGIISAVLGLIQRIAMADRNHGDKYCVAYAKYSDLKAQSVKYHGGAK